MALLVELCVRQGTIVHYCFVITEQVTRTAYRYSKVVEGQAEVESFEKLRLSL